RAPHGDHPRSPRRRIRRRARPAGPTRPLIARRRETHQGPAGGKPSLIQSESRRRPRGGFAAATLRGGESGGSSETPPKFLPRGRVDASAEGGDLPVEPGEGRLLVLARGSDLGSAGQARHPLAGAELRRQIAPLALERDEAELVLAVVPAEGHRLGDPKDRSVVCRDRAGGEGDEEEEPGEPAHGRILARRGPDAPTLNRAGRRAGPVVAAAEVAARRGPDDKVGRHDCGRGEEGAWASCSRRWPATFRHWSSLRPTSAGRPRWRPRP